VSATDIDLSAVSCPSARFCMAVGDTTATSGPPRAMRWDGTDWHRLSIPRPALGVSCPSVRFCMAVGYNRGKVAAPAAEIWRPGHGWRVVPVPAAGVTSDTLFHVSCPSAAFCLAAGFTGKHGDHQLIDRWDGTSWSHVDTGDRSGEFYGVSCTSRRFCMVSGSALARWNGTRMLPTTAPVGLRDPFHADVSCVSPSNCTAAGSRKGPVAGTSSVADRTLIEHWNGSAWRVVGSPNGSPDDFDLSGVSCGARVCTAVGVKYAAATLPLAATNTRR
jgi:hypothetical protein